MNDYIDFDGPEFARLTHTAPVQYLFWWWEIATYLLVSAPHLEFSFVESEPSDPDPAGRLAPPVDLTLTDPERGLVLHCGARAAATVLREGEPASFSLAGVLEGGPDAVARVILDRSGIALARPTTDQRRFAETFSAAFIMLVDARRYGFQDDPFETMTIAGPKALQFHFPEFALFEQRHDAWRPWAMIAGHTATFDLEEGIFNAGRFAIPFNLPVRALQPWRSLVTKAEGYRISLERRQRRERE